MFTRVTTALSLAAPNIADEIPPFNPLQIVATAGNAQRATDDPAADANADVSMIKRSLSTEEIPNFSPASLSDEDAKAGLSVKLAPSPPLLEEGLTVPTALLNHSVASPNVDPGLLSYAPSGLGPFSSLDVKVVPENVAVVPKLDEGAAEDRRNGTPHHREAWRQLRADAAQQRGHHRAGQADSGDLCAQDA